MSLFLCGRELWHAMQVQRALWVCRTRQVGRMSRLSEQHDGVAVSVLQAILCWRPEEWKQLRKFNISISIVYAIIIQSTKWTRSHSFILHVCLHLLAVFLLTQPFENQQCTPYNLHNTLVKPFSNSTFQISCSDYCNGHTDFCFANDGSFTKSSLFVVANSSTSSSETTSDARGGQYLLDAKSLDVLVLISLFFSTVYLTYYLRLDLKIDSCWYHIRKCLLIWIPKNDD